MTEQEKKNREYLDLYLEGTVRKMQALADEASEKLAQAKKIIATHRKGSTM